MLEKLEDIQKAIDNKAYISALTLTLTIPDICGKVENPRWKSKKRYIKWFDENITMYYNPQEPNDLPEFDGNACYDLRCRMLHEGNSKTSAFTYFELRINGPDSCTVSWCSTFKMNVVGFCNLVCIMAKDYHEKNKDKDFSDTRVKMVDVTRLVSNLDEHSRVIANIIEENDTDIVNIYYEVLRELASKLEITDKVPKNTHVNIVDVSKLLGNLDERITLIADIIKENNADPVKIYYEVSLDLRFELGITEDV